MLTFTSLTSRSSAIRSSTGATAWHGPHHSAQKSTMTLPWAPVTSVSKVVSVASTAIASFRRLQREKRPAGGESSRRYDRTVFRSLPPGPDSNALELEVLERWEREGTFAALRERNRGGPKWSFIDGPVTANKTLAVHTAW